MFSLCARRLHQTVWRWGGAGKSAEEVAGLTGLESVTSLSNGLEHSAVVADGKLFTYGSNKFSQLGRSGSEEPGQVALDSPPVAVSCGAWHTVSLHADGSVRSFGWGGSFLSGAGALGLGSKSAAAVPTPIPSFEEGITQIACGNQHTLFLTESGKVLATGHGAYGILGTGETSDELLPVELSVLQQTLTASPAKICCGGNFSAILTTAGSLFVWGRNDSGQLGLGQESQGDMHSAERYPRQIPFFDAERTVIRDIACGENHVVALASNGAIYYWGDRTWLEPHLVSLPEVNGGLRGVKKIVAGSKHSLALTEDGLLYAWGGKEGIVPTLVDPKMFRNQKVLDVAAARNRCSVVTSSRELVATSTQEAESLHQQLGQDVHIHN